MPLIARKPTLVRTARARAGELMWGLSLATLLAVGCDDDTSALVDGEILPPGTVTDLAVTGSSATSVTLRFTQVNNGAGAAADYQVRYRVSSPDGHWGTATVVANGTCAFPVRGTAVGAALTCSVDGLQSATPYTFQLAGFRTDATANLLFGPLSNTADGTTTGGGGGGQNGPPNTPSIVSVNGVTATGATFTGSAFSDPNAGNTHGASEWQVDESGGDWSTPVATSGVGTNLTSWTAAGLTASTAYQARVRYRDNLGAFSAWSANASFSTTAGGGGGGGGGGSATIRFSSNWTAGLGTSENAITDGGRFNRRLCGGETGVVEIVAGSSIGWSGPGNVMRVRRNAQRCTQVDANDTDQNGNPVARPALGLTHGQNYYIRMYTRVDLSGTYEGANHPVAINSLGNIQGVPWAPKFQSPPNPILPQNTYNPEMVFDATSGSLSDAHWVPTTPISMRTWYRHEWFIEFVNVTGNRATFRIHPRIYDMAGNLIRDDATFHRHPGWGNPAQTLAQFYASGGLFVFDDVRLSHNFGVGYEGPAGANDTGEYWYHAAVAIATGDWVGP